MQRFVAIRAQAEGLVLCCRASLRSELFPKEWCLVQNLQSEAPDALHHSAVVYKGSMLVWAGTESTNALYEFRFGSRSWSRIQVKRECGLSLALSLSQD